MVNEPKLYEEQSYEGDNESADIEDSTTKVGISQKSQVLTLIVIGVIVIAVAYFMFSGDDTASTEQVEQTTSPLEKPKDEEGKIIVQKTPKKPDETFKPLISNIEPEYEEVVDVVPQIAVPELPPVADVKIDVPENQSLIPTVGSETISSPTTNNPNLSRLDQLNAGPTGVKKGGAPGSDQAPIKKKNQEGYQSIMLLNGSKEGYSGSSGLVLNNTTAPSVTAEKLPYPMRTIAEGKLIDAVLETAINTDFEGKVRAIVSRDIYSDFGKNVLIPKGSRVIGSYSGSVEATQTRVLVNWQRLIRPDAVDIMINSPASDQFGRSGVPGDVDNKYLEIFNNAMLLSLLTVGSAIVLDEVSGSDGTTVDQDSDGSTTTSGTATDQAASDIVDTLTSTGETVLTDLLNVTPTITVPHGTRIKIFVNQDLLFPETGNESTDGITIVK